MGSDLRVGEAPPTEVETADGPDRKFRNEEETPRMSHPKLVLLVKFRSKLSLDEISAVVDSRADEFRALSGLKQKYYLQDAATGEIGGLYLWDSPEALNAYRESELRASIAAAYQATAEPRIEVFNVLKTLRDGDGS